MGLESFQSPPSSVARPSGSELAELMAQILRQNSIELAYSAANKDNGDFVVQIDLTGAGGLSVNPSLMSALYPNGRKITQPFKSVYVAAATDGNTSINLIAGAQDANSYQSGNVGSVPLSLKDSYISGRVKAQGLLIWTNQPGKSITLVFSLDGEVRSGSQTITISGGVTVSDGSSVNSTPLGAAGTSGSLAATAVAAILCPANASRKCTTVQFSGGSARVGDSQVLLGGPGIVVQAGQPFQWRNTGALYWVIESGAPVANANEET
jgi:hypothetical protein